MNQLVVAKQYDMEVVSDIELRVILHWNYRNLTEIPQEVLKYGNHLRELYLKRNLISVLPPELGKLENLTNLYLIGNQLQVLPPEIGQLRNLKVLDLSQNYISELPSSIGSLLQLEHLILTHNQIHRLPPEFYNLKDLVFLELSGNRLRSLSDFLVNGLESLEELIIDQNPFQLLPRNLSQLPKLRYLSICQGNLTFLPGLPCFKDQINQYSPNTTILQPLHPQIRVDGNPKLNYLPHWVFNLIDKFDCYGSGIEAEDDHSRSVAEFETRTLSESFLPQFPRIRLFFKGKPHTLHFDEDLCKISQPTTMEPCTLVELCLRSVYSRVRQPNVFLLSPFPVHPPLSTQANRKWDHSLIIPPNLARLLLMGPVARCLQCTLPIFTQLWPLVFPHSDHILNLHDNINLHQPLPDQMRNPNYHPIRKNSIQFSVIYICSSSCILKFRRTFDPNNLQNEIPWSF